MSEEHALVAGRYRLDELIGRGGMGDVFKGTDTQPGDTVAVKRLYQSVLEENPDILDRFTREGEALRQLNHPSIVPCGRWWPKRDAITWSWNTSVAGRCAV